MLRFAVIAAIGMLTAAGMAVHMLAQAAPVEAAAPEQAAAPVAAPQPVRAADLRGPVNSDDAPASTSDAEALKGPDGQYWAEGQVDGTRLRLLVDTGASQVALTQTDAQRLGFDPQALTYDVPVHTASGESRAAHVRLASLAVGGARVDNVDAMVVQQGLNVSLLGMSYLGRLSRFEATPQALILRP